MRWGIQRTRGAIEVAAIVHAVMVDPNAPRRWSRWPSLPVLRAQPALLAFFIHGMLPYAAHNKAIGNVVVGVAVVQLGIKGVQIPQLIGARKSAVIVP